MVRLSQRLSQISAVKLAYAAKQLRSKQELIQAEPIAIIGMGCRFPGGVNDPDSFWELLRDGNNPLSEVSRDRWDIDTFYDPDPDAPGKVYTRSACFLDQVDQFDAQFFGITPREMVTMDPQQRLLLEVAWESLEHAGMPPPKLRGSRTGVFVGSMFEDYTLMTTYPYHVIDLHTATGFMSSVLSGRLAYVLDLKGPNITLNTACSSSLVSVHLACQSLRLGESDLALACGVNLLFTPQLTVIESRAHMLSPDGRCKAFDASADGYGRGEGCGIFVLKRLSDAMADGDNILALIRGSAVNQDGRSSGLTVPNGIAQEEVAHQALASSGLEPEQVSYVEAHGTGTALGDPLEIGALAAVFAKNRSKDNPLIVGSVKTNIGHTEGAAGIAGLIKVVLSMQHKEIPPHLHFKNPNPLIPWESLSVTIPTERTPWPAGDKSRFAGVNSFGFSGTNAHIVLEEAPLQKIEEEGRSIEINDQKESRDRPYHLLTQSAKSDEALKAIAVQYKDLLAAHDGSIGLADVCYSANTGRAHHQHRMSLVASSAEEMHDNLAAYHSGLEAEAIIQGEIADAESTFKVAFLFTGQGSQYQGMGRQLYETQPAFRRTLDQCAEILGPFIDQSLISVIYPKEGQSTPLNDTAYTQPALFALEYALAQLWKSWGIEPSVVAGHSVGEYVAACVAGIFSLEDGLKLIAERARLMQALPENGGMISIMADEARVSKVIEPWVNEVSIAAINGPASVVISGASQALNRIVSELESDCVKTRKLSVSHAFHSPLMNPILKDFEKILRSVTFSNPRISLVSNVTGELTPGELTNPDYWLRHLLEPVRFADGMTTLYDNGYRIFLEVGPKPVLSGMGCQIIPDEKCLWLPSLRDSEEDWKQLLESLSKLYVHGVDIDWIGFDKGDRTPFFVPI